MKLAEALILRSDMQKRMEQIKSRILNNILVQEGDLPSEDPNALVEEYMHLQEDLTKLIQGINRTNHETLLEGKKSLSEALVERDALLVKRNILAEAASQGSEKQNRYSRSEIKYVSTIHIEKFQKEADRLSKRFRELDTKIQAMNWTVEFIEA